VSLSVPDELPSTAWWAEVGNGWHSAALALPVTIVDERILVAGTWEERNWCTGQIRDGVLEATLLDVATMEVGRSAAILPFSGGVPWHGLLAWIRVYEDADGLRAFQWFEPEGYVPFGPNLPMLDMAALATEPLPEDMALPLGPQWAEFDWVAALL
jgi:hypothetical protein